MSDKPSLAERLRSGESAVSIINEPVVDFIVGFEVPKSESATARARRRWHMEPEGEADER